MHPGRKKAAAVLGREWAVPHPRTPVSIVRQMRGKRAPLRRMSSPAAMDAPPLRQNQVPLKVDHCLVIKVPSKTCSSKRWSMR